MARKFLMIKVGLLKQAANYIRKDMGTEEELRQLGRSYLKRPVNAIICSSDYVMEDGHRRKAGAQMVGGPDAEVLVCITDEPIDESGRLEIMIQTAIHTRAISAYEEYIGISQLKERNPGATDEQLGERIGRKPAMMSRILSLGRCVPAVKEAAATGLLGITEWNEFSKCSEERQQELLAEYQSGRITSRDELARVVKKRRSGSKPAVKVSRVNFVLPSSGVKVVVSGAGQSLDDLHESLSESLREVRKARDQAMDIRAFQAVMASKNKKRTD